jgi:hypothetical protein
MGKILTAKCPLCEKEVLIQMGATGSVECPHCHVIFNIPAGENPVVKPVVVAQAIKRSMKVERTEGNKPVIPTGYFEIEPNEKIRQGDLVLTFGSDEWKESRNLGQNILPLSSKIYIRKQDV